MKVTVYSAVTDTTSTRTLPESFSVTDANPRAVALALRVYRANGRQATAKTKTRSEVTMTGKKVYKQKGTGGARHGSRRAPIFVGGGVTFGPHGNQNWSLEMPRRQRTRALAQAFSLRATQTCMMIDLDKTNDKTAVFAKAFDRVDPVARTIIMVLAPSERAVTRGMRNLKRVNVCYANQLNSQDVITADMIVLSELAVETIAARLTSSKESKKPADSKAVTKEVAVEKKAAAKKPVAAKTPVVAKAPVVKKPATVKAPAKKAVAKKPVAKKA